MPAEVLKEYGVQKELTDQIVVVFSACTCAASLQLFGIDVYGFSVTLIAICFLVASMMFGFASHGVLSSAVAGLALDWTKPFELGDRVSIAGASGLVVSSSILSISLLSDTNEYVMLPNSSVFGGVFVNHTRSAAGSAMPGLRRVSIPLRLPISVDLGKAVPVLERSVMATHEFVRKQNESQELKQFPGGAPTTLANRHQELYKTELQTDQDKSPPTVFVGGQERDLWHYVELRVFCTDALCSAVKEHGYKEAVQMLLDAGIRFS